MVVQGRAPSPTPASRPAGRGHGGPPVQIGRRERARHGPGLLLRARASSSRDALGVVRLKGVDLEPARRARSSAWPASPATARASCWKCSPGCWRRSGGYAGRSGSIRKAATGRRPAPARAAWPMCRRTATERRWSSRLHPPGSPGRSATSGWDYCQQGLDEPPDAMTAPPST